MCRALPSSVVCRYMTVDADPPFLPPLWCRYMIVNNQPAKLPKPGTHGYFVGFDNSGTMEVYNVVGPRVGLLEGVGTSHCIDSLKIPLFLATGAGHPEDGQGGGHQALQGLVDCGSAHVQGQRQGQRLLHPCHALLREASPHDAGEWGGT